MYQKSLYAGGWSGARHVLLYAPAGGGGDLPGTWKWLWSEKRNLPLQVSTGKALLHYSSYTGTSNECFELNVRGLKDYFYSSDANQTPLFRMTILPPTEKLKIVLKKISDFHMRITKEFSD